MLRGAIIGLGNVAVHGHLPGWLARRDVEFVAAVDVSPTRRPVLEGLLPRARWYDSVEALLAAEALDFVDVCTPPAAHAAAVRAALGRGLHVLCEKPLVCTPDDLGSLAALAASTGRALWTVHNWHHAPIVREVRRLVRGGAIGAVRRCLWQVLRTKPAVAGDGDANNWRLDPAVAGGGILVDHGWHAFYVLHGWLGQTPTRLAATLETRRHMQWPVEDTAAVRLEFPDMTAEVFLTWAADVRHNRVELDGTEGAIQVDDDTVVLRRNGSERRWTFPAGLSGGSHHADWFDGVASGFVAEATGSGPRGANLAEASLCVTLLSSAQASSRGGGDALAVAIPPLPSTAG